MSTINREAVKILSLASKDLSAIDAVSAVVSIWWGDMSSREIALSPVGDANDFSLVAEYEGQLVGYMLARLAYVGLPLTGVCIIHSIAVKPEYQDQGIGTLLIEKVRSNCRARGVKTVRALVNTSNGRLAKYCEELGFRPSTTLNFDVSP